MSIRLIKHLYIYIYVTHTHTYVYNLDIQFRFEYSSIASCHWIGGNNLPAIIKANFGICHDITLKRQLQGCRTLCFREHTTLPPDNSQKSLSWSQERSLEVLLFLSCCLYHHHHSPTFSPLPSYHLPNNEKLLVSTWVLKLEGHNAKMCEFDFFNSLVPQWTSAYPKVKQ